MKSFDLTREDVLLNAVHDCYREMFAKAQPAADWDNLIAEYKAGKIDEDKDGPVYDRHYLSYEEYKYIIDKYIEAYKIRSEWHEDIDILKEYLIEGGSKDKYIEAYDDEYGHHPGYRGYEKVAPLKEHIYKIIYSEYDGNAEIAEGVTNKVTDKVMELIETCQNFYLFNRDEQKFRNTLAFGATPTSNAETVKKWWKEHYDVDIEIEEHNPLLFWEYDNYGDNIDEIMTSEEGENWKEIWDKKWKDQIAEREAKYQEKYQELKKQFEKEK